MKTISTKGNGTKTNSVFYVNLFAELQSRYQNSFSTIVKYNVLGRHFVTLLRKLSRDLRNNLCDLLGQKTVMYVGQINYISRPTLRALISG